MNTQIALVDQQQKALVSPQLELIQRAQQGGATIEQMAQLFDLKLRMDADDARRSFNDAMARFKSNPPRITRNVSKKAGSMELHYASLDHVCDALIPALANVGIRHGWAMKQEGSTMTVACTLTHADGHSEGTSMSAPYDTSGGKNAIQAVASAQTYLQRYTLLAATGQAAGGTDDDAQPEGPKMDESAFANHKAALEGASTPDELKAAWRTVYAAAMASGDATATADLIKFYEQRKKAVKA